MGKRMVRDEMRWGGKGRNDRAQNCYLETGGKKKRWGVHVPVFLPVLGRGRWIRGCDRTSRWCRCDRTLGIELNRAEGSMGEDKAVQGAKDD